jgi:hypothetical protein
LGNADSFPASELVELLSPLPGLGVFDLIPTDKSVGYFLSPYGLRDSNS